MNLFVSIKLLLLLLLFYTIYLFFISLRNYKPLSSFPSLFNFWQFYLRPCPLQAQLIPTFLVRFIAQIQEQCRSNKRRSYKILLNNRKQKCWETLVSYEIANVCIWKGEISHSAIKRRLALNCKLLFPPSLRDSQSCALRASFFFRVSPDVVDAV